MSNIGYIHSYESLAAVDGDGVRYAVFLSGCPLRCAYCHNPDTWQLTSGTPTEATALVRKLARYKPYFGKTGGVTFSGGEPLCQAPFLLTCASLLKEEGIRYVLDTSGAVPLTDEVRALIAGAQGLLLDLKFATDADYRTYTGQGIDRPLSTLSAAEALGTPVTVRTVILPGINDTERALDGYLAHLRGRRVRRYELLAYHTMGTYKYERLGLPYPLSGTPPLSPDTLARLQAYVDAQLSLPSADR